MFHGYFEYNCVTTLLFSPSPQKDMAVAKGRGTKALDTNGLMEVVNVSKVLLVKGRVDRVAIILLVLTDLGMTERPSARCQEMRIVPTGTLCLAAMRTISGFSNSSGDRAASGRQASITMPFAVLLQLALWQQRVALDLVDHGHHSGVRQQLLQVGNREIGDTNRAHLVGVLVNGLKLGPVLLEVVLRIIVKLAIIQLGGELIVAGCVLSKWDYFVKKENLILGLKIKTRTNKEEQKLI